MGSKPTKENTMINVQKNDVLPSSNQECSTNLQLGEEIQALLLKQIEDPKCQITINNKKLALDQLRLDNCQSNGKALFSDKSTKQLQQGQKHLPQVIHGIQQVQNIVSNQQQLVQDRINNGNVSESEAKLLTMTAKSAQVK